MDQGASRLYQDGNEPGAPEMMTEFVVDRRGALEGREDHGEDHKILQGGYQKATDPFRRTQGVLCPSLPDSVSQPGESPPDECQNQDESDQSAKGGVGQVNEFPLDKCGQGFGTSRGQKDPAYEPCKTEEFPEKTAQDSFESQQEDQCADDQIDRVECHGSAFRFVKRDQSERISSSGLLAHWIAFSRVMTPWRTRRCITWVWVCMPVSSCPSCIAE